MNRSKFPSSPPFPSPPILAVLTDPMRLTVRAAAAIIALASLAAYANSFGGAWIFDDFAAIVNNPTIRDWRTMFTPPAGGLTVSGRPLLNASFALSYALSGAAPWGHHALNLVIHTLAVLTLFGVARRTLLLPSVPAPLRSAALPLGFFVALLWTVHPLHTESVTYVVQRAESLMGLGFFLTFYCALRVFAAPADHPSHVWRWTVGAVAACLFAVATKEVAVVAPVLVLLHDRTFAAGSFRAALSRRRALYFGLFATWLPLGALVLSTGGNRSGTTGFDVGIGAIDYALTQCEAVTRYLALAFFPQPLVFEYGLTLSRGFAEVAPYALVLAPLVAATAWAMWRRPALGFLGAWFFAILAPTSLTPSTVQTIVEHRTYLSLAAPLTLAVVLAHTWLGRRAVWLGVVAALIFATLTERRNRDYRSELTLWADTVAKRPANPAARNGLALAQLAAGETAAALEHFAAAVRLAPNRADYLANYAGALARAGRPADAVARYEEALRLRPDYAEAHTNLALILSETDRPADALAHADTAIRLAPGYAPAHLNRGLALVRAGRSADALASLTAALRLDPASPEAHNTLGVALISLGRAPEAAPHFESALRLRPGYTQAADNLARLRALHRTPSP